MNIFLTGGTGYLGSTLISRLINEKNVSKIITLVRDPEKARYLIAREGWGAKFKYVHGDLMHGRSWVETGSTMLLLAMDALKGFEPHAVSDDDVGEALDWLARLEDQIALFREELKAGR